ncbi:unnamed protein product [Polarella glacialis]|uniref:SET domain-containing protein n=1 Tax=Polarella glacialis TaxID=89957 RepID=A0A813J3H2_POLGL|nr:unnamed protein product [Polarella glacialis]
MDGWKPADRVGVAGCRSPYAVGHFVNHPSEGVQPSVGWQEFRWEDSDAEIAANRLHRGLWYMDPCTGEPVNMPWEGGSVKVPRVGVAIVALRDIAPGEEIYMDYKLSKPHPPWYSPVDS